MRIETAKALVEASNVYDVELRLYEDYSGRCMYGKTTAGVVGDLSDLLVAVAMASQTIAEVEDGCEEDLFLRDLRGIRQDNMGRDTIWY